MTTLLELARAGAHRTNQRITSGQLAEKVGISQQTAARHIAEFENAGLVTRTSGPRGQEIRITKRGLAELQKVYSDLTTIFGAPREKFELTGKIVSGMGEGKYYVGQDAYGRQFREKFGFKPLIGTLDIQLDSESIPSREALQALPGMMVEGFETDARTFGPVKCFNAKIRGTKVGLVLPARTHHTNVIELVAPIDLKKHLRIREGSKVKVEVVT